MESSRLFGIFFFSCLDKVSKGSNRVLRVETLEEEECILIV